MKYALQPLEKACTAREGPPPVVSSSCTQRGNRGAERQQAKAVDEGAQQSDIEVVRGEVQAQKVVPNL
jgi:hypothetical protein